MRRYKDNAMMKRSTHFLVLPESCRGCKAVRIGVGNSFRSGFSEMKVGKDGDGPIQPADLSGSYEAPYVSMG